MESSLNYLKNGLFTQFDKTMESSLNDLKNGLLTQFLKLNGF